jgi:hypothetical protein
VRARTQHWSECNDHFQKQLRGASPWTPARRHLDDCHAVPGADLDAGGRVLRDDDHLGADQNILIKANTNPKFNANDTVQGIMYIESPNVVTFNGNFNLQGFIVMEQSASTTDALNFKGNFSQTPVPSDKAFDDVRSTTGVSVLAPGAAMYISGSVDSILKGNVIVDTFHNDGSADIQIDRGTLMTLNPNGKSAWFEGKTVKFTATGAKNAPNKGITYSSYYNPDPTSWQEPTE